MKPEPDHSNASGRIPAAAAWLGLFFAVVLAVASAATNVPLPADVVAFGEIGLGGEVRGVRDAGRRLAEAGRAGFRRAVTAASTPTGGVGDIEVVRVPTVAAALAVLELSDDAPRR